MIVRPLAGCRDDDAVRRIFRGTLGLGRPVPFELPGLARYEGLCLDWYLEVGRPDAAVLERDGAVVGYVLVCTDPASHAAAQRREAARFAAWAGPRIAARRLPEPARTFWSLRLRDGWRAWRSGGPARPHAHVNLQPEARISRASLELLAHVDARVGAAGHRSWAGEVNAVRGRRAVALERVVGPVVDRTPSLTYSWLAGRPVDRLRVVRPVAWTRCDVSVNGRWMSTPPSGGPPVVHKVVPLPAHRAGVVRSSGELDLDRQPDDRRGGAAR